jgi:hypothetical protein
MGILGTYWKAEYEGHHFTVSRNEVTKGFNLDCDGRVAAKKSWSLIGTGEIVGKIEHAGREIPVKLVIPAFAEAKLYVDGAEVKLKQVG